jgi:hypothetical protein
MISARLATLAALILLAAPAAADDTKSGGGMAQMGNMPGTMHHNASMHTMPATVTAVDDKTGLVEVNTAGMALKVHFPPAALSGLKAGDKITLHLGFTKP